MKYLAKQKQGSILYLIYPNNPKYWDQQAFANIVDPDQMPQNVYIVCNTYSNILDALRGSRMHYFKF